LNNQFFAHLLCYSQKNYPWNIKHIPAAIFLLRLEYERNTSCFKVPRHPVMKFTREQQQIIAHRGGHARVSAVAGSGKTTTMIARVGALLEQGVPAGDILVLMFNRSAREAFEQSMRARLTRFTDLPEIRTFHSLGFRLVNSFVRRGVLPQYRLETKDFLLERLARAAAGEAFRRIEGEGNYLPKEQVEEFLAFIDLVKGAVEGPAAVLQSLHLGPKFSFFIEAFELFEEQRRRARLRFYSDLIYEPLQALSADGKLVNWVENRVAHIIVDEYQDINESQQQLLKIIAGSRAEVMVVGDVDQCIYEWRGARPEYIIKNFALDFPSPCDYSLSFTFRYGHALSLAANHLIANNLRRDKKLCISHESNGPTEILSLEEQPGTHPVATVLRDWLKKGHRLAEAAVLVRLYAQSVPVELALLSEGIPYRLEGGADLFGCEEIVALLGYLRLAASRFTDLAPESLEATLRAMLNQPHPGIKKEELESVLNCMLPLLQSAPGEAAACLSSGVRRKLPPFILRRIEDIIAVWRWLLQQDGESPAAPLLRRLVDKLDLYDFYHSISARTVTAENRVKTCEALIDFARGDDLSVNGLLDRIEEFRCRGSAEREESLLLTSIHRAKGLEWPLVILPGLEEGCFPFFKGEGGEESMEDERRLFYVAITRAIEKLVCIHPPDARLKKAMVRGSVKRPTNQVRASRFLYEENVGVSMELGRRMDAGKAAGATIHGEDLTIVRRYLAAVHAEEGVQLEEQRVEPEEKTSPRPHRALGVNDLQEGLKVLHPSWGTGQIVAIHDRSSGRITVDFPEEGEVLLLVKYAKLEVVE
jgi:DNA helicase-2/ATP-dependent DNA helicase PcrA